MKPFLTVNVSPKFLALRVKYGLEKITPQETPKEHEEIKSVKLKDRELPPWNGFGSFEDSAQNCVTVEMKPLLKDLKNFLRYDRYFYNVSLRRLAES